MKYEITETITFKTVIEADSKEDAELIYGEFTYDELHESIDKELYGDEPKYTIKEVQ